jgi:hypothetical protein
LRGLQRIETFVFQVPNVSIHNPRFVVVDDGGGFGGDSMKLRSWYAVYANKDDCPEPSSLLAALRPKAADLALEEFSDESPWKAGVIKFPEERVPSTNLTLTPYISLRRGLTDFDQMLLSLEKATFF